MFKLGIQKVILMLQVQKFGFKWLDRKKKWNSLGAILQFQ